MPFHLGQIGLKGLQPSHLARDVAYPIGYRSCVLQSCAIASAKTSISPSVQIQVS